MIRAARSRIDDLFGLAVSEGERGSPALANRYVALARAIGTRYNVRVPREFRELYCRRCSTFWREGRTVRTRLRRDGRVRTCLVCGGIRRLPTHAGRAPRSGPESTEPLGRVPGEALAGPTTDLDEEAAEIGSEDEE